MKSLEKVISYNDTITEKIRKSGDSLEFWLTHPDLLLIPGSLPVLEELLLSELKTERTKLQLKTPSPFVFALLNGDFIRDACFVFDPKTKHFSKKGAFFNSKLWKDYLDSEQKMHPENLLEYEKMKAKQLKLSKQFFKSQKSVEKVDMRLSELEKRINSYTDRIQLYKDRFNQSLLVEEWVSILKTLFLTFGYKEFSFPDFNDHLHFDD